MSHPTPSVFRSPLVTLRPWRSGDGPAMTEAVESSYYHLASWMPWATPSLPVEESEARIKSFRASWEAGEDFVIAVFDPSGERALGGTGFHLRHGPASVGIAEIGLWIRADSAGKGLGQHVLRSLVTWAWEEWPWERLVWRCDSRNVASRRVAERCGFLLEGVARSDAVSLDGKGRRDSCWYARLRSDPRG